MELKCVVVEDDPIAMKIIKDLVEKTQGLILIGDYTSADEAINHVDHLSPDLIFLDIEMPGMTGLDFLTTLKIRPNVIITSSKMQYAVDAFEYEVVDFLLKPIESYGRFLQAIQKVNGKNDQKETGLSDSVFVKIDSLFTQVKHEDIFWVEASGDYVKIKTKDEFLSVYSRLTAFMEKLPYPKFVRVHRSFIVATDKIVNLDQHTLQVDKKIIPISQKYKDELYKVLRI